MALPPDSKSRASAWAGKEEEGPQVQEQHQGAARRAKGRGEKKPIRAPAEGAYGEEESRGTAAVADDRAPKKGNSGSGGDGDDRDGVDDNKTEAAAPDKRLTRDSMASDAQRLTSEFAAGRLTAPHFFGAMLVKLCGNLVWSRTGGGRRRRLSSVVIVRRVFWT